MRGRGRGSRGRASASVRAGGGAPAQVNSVTMTHWRHLAVTCATVVAWAAVVAAQRLPFAVDAPQLLEPCPGANDDPSVRDRSAVDVDQLRAAAQGGQPKA